MVHETRTNNPMSAAANAELAQEWAERMERRESARSGLPLKEARPIVARRIGVAPGTLENLRRGRIKDPRKSLFDRLKSAMVRELEAEMRAHEHEIQILKQIGEDPRGDAFAEVETRLSEIREVLAEA